METKKGAEGTASAKAWRDTWGVGRNLATTKRRGEESRKKCNSEKTQWEPGVGSKKGTVVKKKGGGTGEG